MSVGQDHEVQVGSDPAEVIRRRLAPSEAMPVESEAELLRVVASHVRLRVPQVLEVISHDTMRMERIPGAPLLRKLQPFPPSTRRRMLAAELGDFIGAVAGIPAGLVDQLIPTDGLDLEEHQAEAQSLSHGLGEELPATRRPAVARFAGRRPPSPPEHLYVAHNDLGAEHVFVVGEELTISGIIDFSDAAVSDPALDLGLVMRDLGTDAFGHALSAYAASGADMQEVGVRALYYARVRALEDLAFGLERNAVDYRDNALRAIDQLFADVVQH